MELRGAWLISSNVEANTRFYNALGFHTVATIFAGDSNPTWQEEPVPIAIVSLVKMRCTIRIIYFGGHRWLENREVSARSFERRVVT